MQNLRVATAPTLKLIQSLFHSLNAPHRKQSISLSSAEILSGHLSIKSIASVQLISQMIWPELNSPRCNGIHISFLLSIWASLNAPSPLFFKGALAAINTFCVVKKGHWHTGFTEWGQLKAAGTDLKNTATQQDAPHLDSDWGRGLWRFFISSRAVCLDFIQTCGSQTVTDIPWGEKKETHMRALSFHFFSLKGQHSIYLRKKKWWEFCYH